MLDILQGIWDFITAVWQFFTDLISSVVRLISLLGQSLQYIESILFLIPGELLIFGVAFLFIFIFNRLTFGNNSGGSK